MLGGLLDGDAVAERRQLGEVVANSPLGVDASRVVVGAEVVVAGTGVGQQVPDDDQDGPGDRDERLQLAAAFDDAAVPLAEEGVGAGSDCGGLAERPFR